MNKSTQIRPEQLLSLIDENVNAVIWLMDSDLKERPLFFDQLDYLFDGMLTKHIDAKEGPSHNKALFFNEMFGKHFALAAFKIDSKTNVDDFLNLLPNLQNLNVVVLGKGLSLNKKYPHIEFKYLLPM